MARKPMTDKEKNARAAKARATREANKKKALEQMGLSTERKKVRKARKPMTAEQKAAAAERLAKAREAKGGPKYTAYNESVRALPDGDTFSIKNVHEWLKYQKDLLKSMRGWKDSKYAKERVQYAQTQTYIENLEKYLRTGVYFDYRYGIEGQNTVKVICRAMAYYPDGTPKRTEGVWYPDIGTVWTKDLVLQDE